MKMLFRSILLVLFAIAVITPGNAQQSIFTSIAPESLDFEEQRMTPPQAYRAFAAEQGVLEAAISKSIKGGSTIHLPLPDGTSQAVRFSAYEVAEPGFYKKYPSILTFQMEGASIHGQGALTPRGFHAVIRKGGESIYIDPVGAGSEGISHIAYYVKDDLRATDLSTFQCGDDPLDPGVDEDQAVMETKVEGVESTSDRPPLRRYRFAAATTGEYSQFHGGTKQDVAAELAVMFTRVNEIMRRELSIEYVLIENTDTLFFLDPDNDGFNNGNTDVLINQVNGIISDYLDNDEYDIGHVFCTTGSGFSGLAATNSICNNSSKRRAVSCSAFPRSDAFYVGIVCHEIGHQMGSRHSFNNCGFNENLATGYEPGSGTTIMSYGLSNCPAGDVQGGIDPYYNIGSLESISEYMHEGFGNSCAEEMATSGPEPTIELPYEEEEPVMIPISTPFELEARAVQSGNTDEPLYCWEQRDAASLNCDTRNPTGNCPLFRSFPPTTDSVRVFPRIEEIIAGNNPRWEQLPSYGRDLTFTCTLRDWDDDGGALDWAFMSMKSIESAGPFTVADINGTYDPGDQITVSWNVAGTDEEPINCETVDIYLSTDGGFTFPHLLAADVPNQGRLRLNAPNIPTLNGKIKVKASNNVFFNLSGETFQIRTASEPGFTGSFPDYFKLACLPNIVDYSIQTAPILNYEEELTVADVEGLPAGAEYSIDPQSIIPGDSITVTVDFGEAPAEEYRLQAVLTSGLLDTVRVEIRTRLVSNDFSGLMPIEPMMGAEGVNRLPEFSWDTVQDAEQYILEITSADDPLFEEGIRSGQLSTSTIQFTGQPFDDYMEEGKVYLWRIVPVNDCGEGSPSPVSAFKTAAFDCTTQRADDLPQTIRTNSGATVESEIEVSEEGIVEDINILNVRGSHRFVGEIRARVVSPSGTVVRLFTEECFNLPDFDVSFDDDAPTEIECPLSQGNTHQPQDSLSSFAGEPTAGTWTLVIEDRTAGSGGSLQNWQLEVCGSIATENPSITKDTVYVSRGKEQFLTPKQLLAEKAGQGEFDLRYIMIDAPQSGTLIHGATELVRGMDFYQYAIDQYHIIYRHDGSDQDTDYMTFLLLDSENGWSGVDTLYFKVDEVLSTPKSEVQLSPTVFPNPAKDRIFVQVPQEWTEGWIELMDYQGRLLKRKPMNGQNRYSFRRNGTPSGVYFIKVTSGDRQWSEKVIFSGH